MEHYYALLVVAAGVAMIISSASGLSDGAAQEFLEAHNEARGAVGVGALKWSESLAKFASQVVRNQREYKGCQSAYVSLENYGTNQVYLANMGAAAMTPRVAVSYWVAENKYYNHTDNSCRRNRDCGAYTQLVRNKTSELGCALATCAKERTSLGICIYYPPGDYYFARERPY